MRGVYLISRNATLNLARIIPACAGFTRRSDLVLSLRGDHPRLRGVYCTLSQQYAASPGSSPLARGLRRLRLRGEGLPGIIPACAGFTSSSLMVSSIFPDHPRLRGVYRLGRQQSRCREGSSPLARGLQAWDMSWVLPTRIIPACAGFTDYAPDLGGTPRIIPACAGFTCGVRASRPRAADHPRLRGVYRGLLMLSLIFSGSSPLARGLRDRHQRRLRSRWIIPACAGFT